MLVKTTLHADYMRLKILTKLKPSYIVNILGKILINEHLHFLLLITFSHSLGNYNLQSAVRTYLASKLTVSKMKPYKQCQGTIKRLQHGGRRLILKKCWQKFTVLFSMKRFVLNGGGILLLRENSDGSPVLAQIGWKGSW